MKKKDVKTQLKSSKKMHLPIYQQNMQPKRSEIAECEEEEQCMKNDSNDDNEMKDSEKYQHIDQDEQW